LNQERKFYAPSQYHSYLTRATVPSLHFTGKEDFTKWQKQLRRRLINILGIDAHRQHKIKFSLKQSKGTDLFTCQRVEFQAEPFADVPGYLLKPKEIPPPWPVMLCLQGHSPDMNISLGKAKTKHNAESIKGGRDIAIQAVRHGWAALCIEQRAFGERKESELSSKWDHPCIDASLHALLLGKTLTGERVFDVMRAIDFIETQDDLDSKRIAALGNSTGGTVSFYAACVDKRIRLAVVSCSFCTYEDSWLSFPHCPDGYLPGILKYADMGDLAGLIAPRHLLIAAGKKDPLARFSGVKKAYNQTQKIYTKANCPQHISLIVGTGGHQFYPKLTWPRIEKIKKEWKKRE